MVKTSSKIRVTRKKIPMIWIITGLIAVFVIFAYGRFLGLQNSELLTISVLSATLIAVLWYSQETRLKRLQQEQDAELRHHPWISIERQKSNRERSDRTLVTKERFPFMVQNLGTTPAYNLKVTGNWHVTGNAGSDDFEGNIEHDLGTILPAMKRSFEINIEWELVSRICVDFEVSYQSWQGGGGRFRYQYDFIQDENNSRENEQCDKVVFWLSDRTKISAPAMSDNMNGDTCAKEK